MEAQETIIDRLVTKNPSYDAYFLFFIFWATFGRKMGVVTMLALNGQGPSKPTKMLAHWVNLLGQPLF